MVSSSKKVYKGDRLIRIFDSSVWYVIKVENKNIYVGSSLQKKGILISENNLPEYLIDLEYRKRKKS